jgi:hypothetical protein
MGLAVDGAVGADRYILVVGRQTGVQ